MSFRSILQEDAITSCRVLASLIGDPQHGEFQTLLLQDFVSKCETLHPEEKSVQLAEVLKQFVPSEVKNLIGESNLTQTKVFIKVSRPNKPNKKRRTQKTRSKVKPQSLALHADVAFVTVIEKELFAAKLALGIRLDSREDHNMNGLRIWKAQLRTANGEKSISIILTMIGEARNVPCAVACGRLFNMYHVGTAILVGIAAGLKGKVGLGDVVAAEDAVLDYEGQRLEEEGVKERPTVYRLGIAIKRDLEHYQPVRTKWHNNFVASLPHLRKSQDLPRLSNNWKPIYHTGVILAGEKLIANKSLPSMQKKYHEKVRAAEQEGSGFARTCEEYSIPWLVFRGISDFGDRHKQSMQKWQPLAALSAATCAVEFISTEFRRGEEREF